MKLMRRPTLMACSALAVLTISVLTAKPASAAGSLKLFEATPVTSSVPKTDPSKAETFDTKSVTLFCGALPAASARLASTGDGTGKLVVDNLLLVNGVNVCTGLLEEGNLGSAAKNCYQVARGPVGADALTGYDAIEPVDISDHLAAGKNTLSIEMSDWGGALANSEVWLVTNCTIQQ